MNQEMLATELVKLAKSIVAVDRSSKLTLSIDGSGATFADNPAGEYARLLELVSKMISMGKMRGRLLDINGNPIGKYEVK